MTDSNAPEQTGRLRALLSHLARPADDWAYQGDERRSSILTWLMLVLLGLLGVLGAFVFFVVGLWDRPWIALTLAGLLISAAGLTVILMIQVRQHLVAPLTQLYAWALRMCDGDFSARIPASQQGRFEKLSFHINRLSEALDRLANEMDDMVWEQTARLQQKNRSIELLYEVAASVGSSEDVVDVLRDATRRLMELTSAPSASIYLVQPPDTLDLTFTLGVKQCPSEEDGVGLERFPDHNVLERARVFEGGATGVAIAIPLRHQEQTLGQIRLFVTTASFDDEAETLVLLDNVGKHLGLAISNDRLDEESRHLVLMRERSSLAYELHDSLAQTIAALRFQLSNLNHTLGQGDVDVARREVARINSSLEEVNTEVRDLIANFRAPMSGGGLLASMQSMVDRFETDTGINTHFQPLCETFLLSPAAEMQILGITREALANIRKHSGANSVRILVQGGDGGAYQLLIEDDGVGMSEPKSASLRGQRVGLSIMRERAERLGGELRIESEPGDGTRIELLFEKPHPLMAPTEMAHAGNER